jgi:hypothetical protein
LRCTFLLCEGKKKRGPDGKIAAASHAENPTIIGIAAMLRN